MIVNELYDGQGLGNQLWNYVVLRILAKQKGVAFSVIAPERFKGSQFMNIDFGAQLTGGSSPEGGPPDTLPDGITTYYRERRENLAGTTVDISRTDPELLAIPPNTKFDGNCQSTNYLEGYRSDILSWITVQEPYKKNTLDRNSCVIHLRCGDFTDIKDVFLPPSYYQQAMEYIKQRNKDVTFYCVTDQKDVAAKVLPGVEIIGASVTKELDSNKASHHHGGPIGIDFCLLMNAAYLIIPNSSFSWWAAYLNTTKKIVVAPKYWARYNASDGFWSTSDIITDGFTYLDKAGTAYSAADCWQEKNTFEATQQDMFEAQKQPTHREKIILLLKRDLFAAKQAVAKLFNRNP
jgi:hypothetical protein